MLCSLSVRIMGLRVSPDFCVLAWICSGTGVPGAWHHLGVQVQGPCKWHLEFSFRLTSKQNKMQ